MCKKLEEDKHDLYYAGNGTWCGTCPAGKFVDKDCIRNSTRAECKICPNGKFSLTEDGVKSCGDCTICDRLQNKTRNCTKTNDTVCVCFDINYVFVREVGCVPKPLTPATPTSSVLPECPEGITNKNSNCSTKTQPCNSTLCKNIPIKNESSSQTEIVIGVCIPLMIIVTCGVGFYCKKRRQFNKKSIELGGAKVDKLACQVEMEPLDIGAQNLG